MSPMESNREQRGDYRGDPSRIGYPRDTTALLVIDPVNDFLSKGGAAWDLTKGTVEHLDVVGNLRRLIDAARERGLPVLFGPMAYTEEDYADGHLQKRTGINRIMYERKMFLAGSWGADFHPDLVPQQGDIVLEPHKGTDVFRTDLPEYLERLGTTHLIIAGMTANLCCESTGRHAAERGFDVTYISDAIGSESMPSYEAAIRLNFPLVGNAVVTVDEFLSAFDAGAGGRDIEPGDKVRGSDDGEIGTVREVRPHGENGQGYLLVTTGAFFGKDLYVPLEAVVRRSAGDLFINVPKLVVGKMPWEAPPKRSDAHEKAGPPAGQVDRLYRSANPTGRSSAEDRPPAQS